MELGAGTQDIGKSQLCRSSWAMVSGLDFILSVIRRLWKRLS